MHSTYRSDLFAGQVALVSGGTSGIGAAIGDAPAAHGAKVTVTGATAAEKIRVNAVAPGWIATQLTAPLQADPTRNAAILGRTPMGRWGLPDDVAHGGLFLCSPAAAFVTGAIVPVDGGYLVA